jgi:F-type H+-transporting ATPase subunit delta
MSERLIAERYANALDRSIDTNADAEQAVQALHDFADMYESHDELRNMLLSPSIPKSRRLDLLKAVLWECKFDPRVERLIEVAFDRGRISVTPLIAEAFAGHTDARLGRARAHITSAAPLSAEQHARIEQTLRNFSGKEIISTTNTDASLLGGVVARVNGTVIDGSLRARLEHLKQALLAEEN